MPKQADSHSPVERTADFRFYQELNDFLPLQQQGKTFSYTFYGKPTVKDTVEAIGIPHTEVDLIVVDGLSVDFDFQLKGGERVAVYPVFECFDISSLVHLRPKPLRNNRFILDVNLGKLARYLRLMGFDSYYRNDLEDSEIIQLAAEEQRIILTRDKGILKTGSVTHGYWVRNTNPREQLKEVISAIQLESSMKPFSRCAACNEVLKTVPKNILKGRINDSVWRYFQEFVECPGCHKVYWKGSHYDRISELMERIKTSA